MKTILTPDKTKLQHKFSRDRPPGEEYTSGMNSKNEKLTKNIPTPVFPGETFTQTQKEIDIAWEKTILRRLEEMRSGKVKGVTREEMRADAEEIRRRHGH